MKINITKIEKFAYPVLAELCKEYVKRVNRFYKADFTIENKSSYPKKGFNVLLDADGKNMKAEEFSEFLVNHMNYNSQKDLNFFIGGPYGFSDSEKESADMLWSLSKSTTTSDIGCLVCCEQIYRSVTIIQGTKYHH